MYHNSPRISHWLLPGMSSSVTGWPSGPLSAPPYQPPQPGNQDCRYWIMPELPLLGIEPEAEEAAGSVMGSRKLLKQDTANIGQETEHTKC